MKRTILVIEDNDAVRENTAELLELSGFHVLTAQNGRLGFDIARRLQPEVIICDIMMPDTDGAAFFKLVKHDGSTATIPLIFFSAGSAPPGVRNGIMQGADEYIRKPFTDAELLEAVSRCLMKKNGELGENFSN